jgi:DNA-directed RNA polymerase subunit H
MYLSIHNQIIKECWVISSIDILEHELVPKHEVLSKSEKEGLFDKFKITKDNLPKILSSDPVVKAINAKTGDVLKITRKSDTTGESLYYRLVVD